MQMALRQAEHGLYTTAPNPRVGCVLVRDGAVIAQAHHRRHGEAHAEALALAQVGAAARGATAYVTLEPCSHHGRNPPCADALIAAGVRRVVVASGDPNPLVNGGGVAALRAAGVQVDTGVCESAARALNIGFFQRMRHGRPWVRIKMAQSLDGRTAMRSGESQWITGPEARADVQRLRARSDAIVTGIDTVLHDDCRLTVRPDALDDDLPHTFETQQPLRVVLDSRLRTPPTARLLSAPGRAVVVTASRDATRRAALQQAGAEVLCLPTADGGVSLPALLDWLGEQHINEVLVEAGARLSGAWLRAGLADRLVIYTAPVLLGSDARPLFELPIANMRDRLHMKDVSITAVGRDWRIDAALKDNTAPARSGGDYGN